MSLITGAFHHALADIFKTRILSLSAATLHLVQQHKQGSSPALTPPLSAVMLSVRQCLRAQTVPRSWTACTHTCCINHALLRIPVSAYCKSPLIRSVRSSRDHSPSLKCIFHPWRRRLCPPAEHLTDSSCHTACLHSRTL